MMDAVVEYRNDQPDEQENDRLDHLFCELRGLREDLRFLRMLSISQGRRIDDIMEQFEPKPSVCENDPLLPDAGTWRNNHLYEGIH